METLQDVHAGRMVEVIGMKGGVRLLTRLSSVGIVPGSIVRVERNDKNRPVLVYGRDTLLALNREEAARIQVEEVI